jgi:hypothetical protein
LRDDGIARKPRKSAKKCGKTSKKTWKPMRAGLIHGLKERINDSFQAAESYGL